MPHHKWDQTARYTWNCCFYAVAVVYLCFYRKYHLTDSLYFQRNGHSYHRSYENLLFHTADNRCALLGAITTILIAFYVVDGIYDLRERSISEAIGKTVSCGILVYFDVYRWVGAACRDELVNDLCLSKQRIYFFFGRTRSKLQSRVFFGDIQYVAGADQSIGGRSTLGSRPHIRPKCICPARLHVHEAAELVICVSQLAAISNIDTNSVWAQVSLMA